MGPCEGRSEFAARALILGGMGRRGIASVEHHDSQSVGLLDSADADFCTTTNTPFAREMLQPLSASLMEQPESPTRTRQPSPSRRRFLPWLRRPSRSANNAHLTEGGAPRNLQITTIVRMPNALHANPCQDRLEEYQIGVEYVPFQQTS